VNWLPDQCTGSQLTGEVNREATGPGGAWEYFADKNRSIPLSISELGLRADAKSLY